MKFIFYFLLIFTIALADASKSEAQDLPMQEIKQRVVPFANGFLQGRFPAFCPWIVNSDKLGFDEKQSSDRQIVFVFEFGSPFAYCNDGAPKKCEITVLKLDDGRWDTSLPQVRCIE